MKWLINNIQKILHLSFLKTRFNFTKKNITDFSTDNVHSAGILFDATLAENVWKILDYKNFLSQKGIKVSLLGYIDHKQPDEIAGLFAEIDFITKKDFNWVFSPISYRSKDFIKNQFDMLLNFYTDECLPLQYMSALSKAKYKIGCYNNNNLYCNDMLIKVKRKGDLEHFILQVKKILN